MHHLPEESHYLAFLDFPQTEFDPPKTSKYQQNVYLCLKELYQPKWLDPDRSLEHNGSLWIIGSNDPQNIAIVNHMASELKINAKRSLKAVVAFSFNRKGNDLQQTLNGLYRSVLFQILNSQGVVPTHFFHGVHPEKCQDGGFDWNIEKLERLIIRALRERSKGSFDDITILINALDIGNSEHVSDVVCLLNFLRYKSASVGIRLYTCLASRYFHEIIDLMPNRVEFRMEEMNRLSVFRASLPVSPEVMLIISTVVVLCSVCIPWLLLVGMV